ncbi:MAG: Release factor glutamine methyltransferase [Pseudomonadota bacterium]|jgi:SAM-dependent methyltransferase
MQESEPHRRGFLCKAGLTLSACTLIACTSTNYGDDLYRLQLASAGKDVMWMPSSRAISMAMLQAAKTEASDLVYDLGSGDGIIPILAAQYFGAKAIGIEYNADLVELSKRHAIRAGVADRVSFKKADLFQVDFSDASVVTLYLGESLNAKLSPRLEQLRPGTRVLSNRFDLGSWRPDQMIAHVPNELAMLWIVPARVGGRWRIPADIGLGSDSIELIQSHQMIELRTVNQGLTHPIGEGRISGSDIEFEIQRKHAPSLRLKGTASPDAKRLSLQTDLGLERSQVPLIQWDRI